MADPWTKAFGLYLRTLRERRALSLAEVASLSRPFADRLNKGYLSRCENGNQRLAFSKVIPLSRILEVPADVLVERMELDMELDQIGVPETEGLGFGELMDRGKRASQQGLRWNAYAYYRDTARQGRTSIRPPSDESIASASIAILCIAACAKALGRSRYALHELRVIARNDDLRDALRATIYDRISICLRSLGELKDAQVHSERAIELAEAAEDPFALGCALTTRGRLAAHEGRQEEAIRYYQHAHSCFRSADHQANCAIVLNNLAQAYFDLGRLASAERAASAAISLAQGFGLVRAEENSELLLGEIDDLQGRSGQAVARWRSVTRRAQEIEDRELRFKADVLLLKAAIRDQNQPVARSIARRLDRLARYMSPDMIEVGDFKRLAETNKAFLSVRLHTS